MKEDTNKKKKIIICIIAVILVAVALIVFLYFRSQIRATTMRVLRLEGEVTLTDNGKDKTVRENLRLNSGNALSTAIESLVSIGLDDTKIVTLDEMSRAEFNQSGRMLDLELTAGSLFFEVQKPLDDDETMDIRTSTMVVGIRGTSGWVSVEGDHESLIVTDGHVHVTGVNPVTGEKKEIEVYAGQRIKTYLYNDRDVDSIMFYVEDVTERDLPEFLLDRLRENPALLEKVCKETGWDKPWILGITTPTPTPKPTANPSDDKLPDTGSEDDALIEDMAEEDSEETEKSGPLTKQQLAWAHSHIAIIDPGTGIFALKDLTLFDPTFYAVTNPDVVAKYGTDPDALLWHYLQRGKKEGRLPIAPPTPTPTITPTWGIVKSGGGKSEEDGGDGSQGTGSGGGTSRRYQNTANNSGDTIKFQNTADSKGAEAQIIYDPNNSNNNRIIVTKADDNSTTTVTVPNSVGIWNSSMPAANSFGPDLSIPNVELDYNSLGNSVDTLDLSSSERVVSTGYVNANDILNYLNNDTRTNNGQLKTIAGPAATITQTNRSGTPATNTYAATITGGKSGDQSVEDAYTLISGMGNNNVTKVTYDGLEINSIANNQKSATVGNNTFTNVTVTQSGNNAYTVNGYDNSTPAQLVTVGTFDNNGFTPYP